jgi:hypothetical protein
MIARIEGRSIGSEALYLFACAAVVTMLQAAA